MSTENVAVRVFKDTRMPVSTEFENLEAGATIDKIIDWFHVTREQVVAVLEFAPVPCGTPLWVIPLWKPSRRGWERLTNGELLAVAEAAGFEVLLTTDKNMRYQQNLTGRKLAFVVLANSQWTVVRKYVESCHEP